MTRGDRFARGLCRLRGPRCDADQQQPFSTQEQRAFGQNRSLGGRAPRNWSQLRSVVMMNRSWPGPKKSEASGRGLGFHGPVA